jgi:hypothetical protein
MQTYSDGFFGAVALLVALVDVASAPAQTATISTDAAPLSVAKNDVATRDQTAAVRPATADGFTPLFNGKDLSGWVNVNTAPETWSAKNGEIFCTGVPTGVLRT